jgi:MinD superfamily P-loop ATPase
MPASRDSTRPEMKIAFLSGKGGAGKTTVSDNVFSVVPMGTLVDCDVEEPNSHLLLHQENKSEAPFSIGFPVVDENLCINCQACSHFCGFNAILANDKVTVVMKELCHDCGGCSMVCPTGAITYDKRPMGTIHQSETAPEKKLLYGELSIGENSGVKLIQEIRKMTMNDELVIIDSPPGTACSAVTAVEGTDHAVIVTEPTPFGLSDMKMVIEMLTEMKIPYSVIINKDGMGDNEMEDFCMRENIPITGRIPFSLELAEIYARGELATEASDQWKNHFTEIWESLKNEVAQ